MPQSKMRRIFLIAGEISGDSHGAALMKRLESSLDGKVEFSGLGGEKMRALSEGRVEDWVAEAGVVGLWEVLKRYGWFRRKFAETRKRISAWMPDAVIFIDYPGFNLRLAKALASSADQAKRIYFISPQVWAWNRQRIPRMANILDLMLCIFPFEKELYEASGLRTEFVGHPFGDEFGLVADLERTPNLVGLFPGSREREVARLLPIMCESIRLIKAQVPAVEFEVSAANEARAKQVESILDQNNCDDIGIEIGKARELMQSASVGVVASGTASLEAAFFGLPYCLVYQVAQPTYLAARAVMRVEHLGMANILAGEEIVKELLQNDCSPNLIGNEVVRLLKSPDARAQLSKSLQAVTAALANPGCSDRAAEAIVNVLTSDSSNH